MKYRRDIPFLLFTPALRFVGAFKDAAGVCNAPSCNVVSTASLKKAFVPAPGNLYLADNPPL